ncbi:MAG: hypothetical protein AAF480_05605 [Actinomycetota bacterium]
MTRWVVLFFAFIGLMLLVGGHWRSSHATGVPVTSERVTVEIVGNPP